ncbi:MAG: DUF4421 family protein [Bacteroidetes bacterium]|nr:DUF4421 family protein [Bacteroidota bacterium]
MRIITLSLFFPLAIVSFAQHDTTYYKEYNDKLIISLYNSFARQNDIAFSQNIVKDTAGKSPFHYYADADIVSGIEFDYDIFGIAFAYKAVPPKNAFKKGKTYYTDLGLNAGGNKWRLETSYKRYEGFYDTNTPNYTPFYSDSAPYYQNPHMTTQSMKAKLIYIKKHNKFSYCSAYACSQQQTKSSFSWIFVSNLYYNRMSTDTSFVPFPIRNFYAGYSDFNGLNVIGLSVGGGFSVNVVLFHKFFGNLTWAVEPESQWRKYSYGSGSVSYRAYLKTSGDARFSFGYNGKKFFFFLSAIADHSNYNSGQIMVTNNFMSGSTTIGYRFRAKKPSFYKKFENTKVYQWL